MQQLREDDFLEIRLAGVITDYDFKVLTSFYQPLLGAIGLALYLTLVHLHPFAEAEPLDHRLVLQRMDISRNDFLIARQRLEALGLLRTYFKKDGEIRFYYYEIYAPKDAYHFLDDPILRGTLVKFIGERATQRLVRAFQEDQPFADVEEISARFIDIFHPNFDDPAYQLDIENYASSYQNQELAYDFDAEEFLSEMNKQGYINKNALTEDELKQVEQLATLYGLVEKDLARLAIMSYQPQNKRGNRINFEQFKRFLQEEAKYAYLNPKIRKPRKAPAIISGGSFTSKEVNEMELLPPIEYLSKLQMGTQLAAADIRLLDDLNSKFNLEPGVINALVRKVLDINHNILSRNYVEKIAATLVRANVHTAIDTLNYFEEATNRFQKPVGKPKKVTKTAVESHISSQTSPPAGDEEEIAATLAALEAQLKKLKD
ncbi:MAG: DnaD domain protein [Bacilli bacterium]|jgi:replication initiation and membrane attachment protein